MHASNLYSACQLQGEQGLREKRLQGAESPELPDFKRGERRTTSSGSEASPGGTSQRILGQASPQPFIPPAPLYLLATLWTSDFPLYSVWLLLIFNEVRLKIHLPGPACLGLKAIKLETNLLIRVSLCKSHLINSLSSLALTAAWPREGIELPRDL